MSLFITSVVVWVGILPIVMLPSRHPHNLATLSVRPIVNETPDISFNGMPRSSSVNLLFSTILSCHICTFPMKPPNSHIVYLLPHKLLYSTVDYCLLAFDSSFQTPLSDYTSFASRLTFCMFRRPPHPEDPHLHILPHLLCTFFQAS